MSLLDLRTFLEKADAIGELKRIHGADRNLEIGAITEISLRNDGPALLFDEIPGFPPNYRVASNVCSNLRRSLLALGMDPDLAEEEASAQLRRRMAEYKPIPPVTVASGPILENAVSGESVDLNQFPVPIWHELDGGPYVGTGVAIIQQDPQTGFVNVGTYRGHLHDGRTSGIFFTQKSKDGSVIMRKYWAEGKACPVAISYGPEPLLFSAACSPGGPRGTSEYDHTGFLAGEPVQVIRGPLTGLPISAYSEIAIEGEIPPLEEEARDEGPFGEWTGYYWGIATKEAVIRIKALYYRDDPILFGAPPIWHHTSYSFGLRAADGRRGGRWEELELPVRSVSSIGPLGATVVALHQQRPDDVNRVMDELERMGSNNRLIFVVDDDVDTNDPWEVLWAVGTRFDPEQARVSVQPSTWNLDPMMTLAERTSGEPIPSKRLIINGCRPFDRLNDFPPVNRFSQERRRQIWQEWGMADWLKRTQPARY